MAVTWTSLGTGATATGGAVSSISFAAATIPAGAQVIIGVATSNSGTSGAAPTVGCTDNSAESGTANSYTQRSLVNNDPGAANAGVTLAVFECALTRALVSDVITISISPNAAEACAVGWYGVSDSGEVPSYITKGTEVTGNGNPAIAEIISGTFATGDTIFGFAAIETDDAVTADSDTTDGSWSSQNTELADAGADAAAMRAISQYKVVTGTTSQGYNFANTTRDWAGVVIVVRWEASTGYTLPADAGSYAITGTAATLKFGRKAAAASGSYAVTGTAATLRRGLPIVAASGSYAVTGTAANLKRGRKVDAAAGSYAVTGTAASVEYGFKTVAAAGSYVVTGQAATLLRTWRVAADAGSYSISGEVATLAKSGGALILGADAGTYAVTGVAASLEYGYKVAEAGAGSYSLGGQAASLKRGRLVVAASESYTVTGADATLLLQTSGQLSIVADAGSYVITGTAATLAVGNVTPTVPEIDRGGIGLSRDRIKELRKAANREHEAREKSYAVKKSERDELRRVLESAWQDAKEAGPKAKAVFVEALPSVDLKAKTVDWQPAVRDHASVITLIDALQKRVVAEKVEAEQARKATADQRKRAAEKAKADEEERRASIALEAQENERKARVAAEQAEQMRIMQDDELMAVFLLVA